MHVRSIATRQAQSLSRRDGDGATRIRNLGAIRRFSDAAVNFKTCQWIDGEPAKMDLRAYGSDKFKCGKPTMGTGSWCEEHHRRVFIRKPLTKATP